MSLRARVGQFAVIQMDCDEYAYLVVIADFSNPNEAIELADSLNIKRTNKKDDTYQVIDDQGQILRGPRNIKNLNIS